MARPRKENLDYFPLDVDFFSDKKIRLLKAKFGSDGVMVYLYILCEVYRNGYYIEYDDDFELIIADEFNFTENKTRQIINYLFSRSLLESILVEPVKVITAKSIQRRYQEAKKEIARKAHRDIIVDGRIWLLKKEETEPCIKVHQFGVLDGKTEVKDGKTPTNKSKVNQSKLNESKVCGKFQIPCRNGVFTVDEEYYTELTHTYPNMDIDESFKAYIAYMKSNPNKQRSLDGIKGSIQWWLNGDEEDGKYRKSNIPNDIQIKGGLNL